MLPASYDDNAAFAVLCDFRQGLQFVLVRNEMLDPPMPAEPLWALRFGDQRSFEAAFHWFAVRRGRWQKWGELAKKRGPEALSAHMAELISREPIGEVLGAIIRGAPGSRMLSLGVMVVTHAGTRREIFYKHRFSTSDERERFINWFCSNASDGSPERLMDLAVREGTGALATKLEEIAAGADVTLNETRAA